MDAATLLGATTVVPAGIGSAASWRPCNVEKPTSGTCPPQLRRKGGRTPKVTKLPWGKTNEVVSFMCASVLVCDLCHWPSCLMSSMIRPRTLSQMPQVLCLISFCRVFTNFCTFFRDATKDHRFAIVSANVHDESDDTAASSMISETEVSIARIPLASSRNLHGQFSTLSAKISTLFLGIQTSLAEQT